MTGNQYNAYLMLHNHSNSYQLRYTIYNLYDFHWIQDRKNYTVQYCLPQKLKNKNKTKLPYQHC